MAIALSMVGIIIGIVALIALFPQIDVAPLDPLDKEQPFNIPFRITNNGFIPMRKVRILLYIHRLDLVRSRILKSLQEDDSWTEHYLDRKESKTIVPNLVRISEPPTVADIAVVVDYRVFPIPFKTFRGVFRFTGAVGNSWQWLPQPSKEIMSDIDSLLAKDGRGEIPIIRPF